MASESNKEPNTHCHDCITLGYTADNVEWNESLSLLGVSTYQLQAEEVPPTRVGSIHLYDISTDGSDKMVEIGNYEFNSGVFDFKWKPMLEDPSTSLLASGLADGNIDIVSVVKSNGKALVESKQILSFKDLGTEGDMVLGVDWVRSDNSGQLAASYQQGGIALWDVEKSEPIWFCPNAHEADVWQIGYIEQNNPFLCMSCSDDCTLKIWDVRVAPSSDSIEYEGRCARIIRQHEGGVTSMVSTELCPDINLKKHFPHVILVGSYDESLSFFDLRMIKELNSTYTSSSTQINLNSSRRNTDTEPLHSFDTGGGVWRIKIKPNENGSKTQIATSCIYNGFQAWSLEIEDGAIKSSQKDCHYLGPHGEKALAYGIDWIQTSNRDRNLLSSCSFYDKKCSVWSF